MTKIEPKMYIGGEWLREGGAGSFTTINPADGTVLADVPSASVEQVDAAVDAARAALDDPEWRDMLPAARARLLWRVAELIEQHADELAELETLDQGQPIFVSRNINIPGTAEHFRYYAGWATKIQGITSTLSIPGTMHYTRREPVGVCALIMPWNFPFLIASFKLAPALACGNTVVLKAAEQTPLTTYRLAELCEQAGVPKGVVNLVSGGPEVGKALTNHPRVDKVSFTGSTEVGRDIVRAAAGNLKRVTLELGGKAPSIITENADIDAAVAGNLQGALFNSGQVCAAYSRFYVHEKVVDEFVTKLSAGAEASKLGPGIDPATTLGPLVSDLELTRVDGLVQNALTSGATAVTGGARGDGDLANGYFYRPTVLAGVEESMDIARKEIFGPVLPVMTYSDPDELVPRANDTEYGLAASVWTTDLKTAHNLAAAIKAGALYINLPPILDPAAPWGGFKASGWGKEMSHDAIEAFSQVKSVWVGV
ncbi:MAG TPA: aldehyde dehydrogenase family protein [Ilumatobacter sp.]|nr:aldehyde dehydrogenase family protein [Ilumatobacter sp.]